MAQYFYYILYNEIVALKLEISKGLIKNQILVFFFGVIFTIALVSNLIFMLLKCIKCYL